jgi:DNA invertase Pin-like site-specific DNA recombinase
MNYLAYYRVSTDRQGQSGLGLEAQQAAVAQFLGHAPSLEFVEVESGRNADRPQLALALAEAKRSGATLIVAKLDRLARDVKMILAIVDSGVVVRFIDLPDIDTGTATGRLILTVMASLAEFEARRISERTKDALAAKKARGERWQSGDPSKGARAAAIARLERSLERHKEIAQTVGQLQAFGCKSLRQIAKGLEARGVKTITGKANWRAAQVAAILERM